MIVLVVITVTRCSGRGQAESLEIYRGLEVGPELVPKIRVDIACNDGFAQVTIDAILDAARRGEGEVGDGRRHPTGLAARIRRRQVEHEQLRVLTTRLGRRRRSAGVRVFGLRWRRPR